MARNLFALLVGINQYDQDSAPELEGCINDVNAIEEYLKGRIDASEYQLHIKRLTTDGTDEKPTRKAVIEGFEQHLCQANDKDVALFFFSGHGSQEVASQDFWHLESDLMNETLVCWDSRTNDWDLADKELGYLISKVSQKNPHILIILDCCHSGSGTRDVEEKMKFRHSAADKRGNRTIDEGGYVFSRSELGEIGRNINSGEANGGQSGWNLPQGRHVVLSACQDSELAREHPGDGQQRGAFTYFLLDSLKKVNTPMTYRELFKGVNALIRSRIKEQTPQLEATNIADLDDLFFLGDRKAVKRLEPYFFVKHNGANWVIEGGAVHGIPQPSGGSILLNIYERGEDSELVGEAKILRVLPRESEIEFTEPPINLTTDRFFKAIIVSLPLPSLGVYFDGDTAEDQKALDLVREELQKASPKGAPSLYVREVNNLTEAQYCLVTRNGEYLVTKPTDDRPLTRNLRGYTPDNAYKAVKDLEHVAKWNTTAELANPASKISADSIKIQVYRVKGSGGSVQLEEITESTCRFEYEFRDGEWVEPSFRIKLTNTYPKRLYCAVLDLPEAYEIAVPPLFQQGSLSQGGIWIEPGEATAVWAALWDGNQKLTDDIPASIPDDSIERGVTEYQDILKFIISTSEFDATLLQQDALPSPTSAKGDYGETKTRSVPKASTLNLLMYRVQTRDIGKVKAQAIDDWATKQIAITTVRSRDAQLLAGKAVQFPVAGVTVQPPAGLRGSVRLSTVPQATRDVGSHILPPILRDSTKAFQFTASRGVDPGLSSLELQVDDAATLASVKPESPILVTVEKTLAENEYVLPIAFDGDFYMPLGRGESKDGKTEIRIERLPDPLHEKTKSLAGSVRIFFQKIACEKLGNEFQYPLLAAVDVDEDGTVHYERDIEAVTQRVAQANRVVLFIHGIIGDTGSMLPSVRHAKISANGQQKSLAEIYDLVLAFDYENLSTPIQDIAAGLKERLIGVGLSSGHGKTFHIVAHSMGGLVSRSFIEQQGGNEIAQHLIMLGTPNAGSPWPKVYDWATTAIAIGINSLSTIAFPVKLLGNLVSLIGSTDNNLKESLATIDDNLKDMLSGSTFLSELQNAADPGIPYTIIAGNTSIIQPQDEKTKNRLDAFLQKLGHTTLEFPFVGQDNDIAVAVESIKSVSHDRSPKPVIKEVACNHLVYFLHADGLEALSWAIVNTGVLENHTVSPVSTIAPVPSSPPPDASTSLMSNSIGSSATTDQVGINTTSISDSSQNSPDLNISSTLPQTVVPVRPDVDDGAANSGSLQRSVGVVVVVLAVVLGAIASILFWQRSQDSAPPNNQSSPTSSLLPALTSKSL